jgi:hypothetical protein
MCGSSIDAREVNIVSFFERYTDINSADKVLVADPRLMLCDGCFSFLKEVVRQAQTVTIDDIEKEA